VTSLVFGSEETRSKNRGTPPPPTTTTPI
jgi:hypothetical protein